MVLFCETCQDVRAEGFKASRAMSEERRPPAPPAPPGDASTGTGASSSEVLASDTPREGTPAFDEMPNHTAPNPGSPTPGQDTPRDGSPAFDQDTPIGGVPAFEEVAGPTPDYASEYVPPRPLPKPSEHKTMEMIPVKISPEAEADPRRALTQKAIHVVRREEAQRQVMLMGVDSAASPTGATQESVPTPQADEKDDGGKRLALIIGGVIALLVLLTIGFAVIKMVSPGSDEAGGSETIPTSTAKTTPPTPASPNVTAPLAATTTESPSPTPSASAAPEPAPSTTDSAATSKKPVKPREEAPKPINE